jgi:pimeloyl-ACP methyl ester carboxylesterase
LQPDITHTVWVKGVPPFLGPQDQIRLHRLVNEKVQPRAAVFILAGMSDEGMDIIADEFLENTQRTVQNAITQNPQAAAFYKGLLDELETFKTRLLPRYLAANGYDVYTIDYRTSFIPKYTQGRQLAFMKDWGWECFISDIKEAMEQAKRLSGQKKLFLAGESFGGMLAMNFASKHYKEDLKGLMLLDGGNGGRWKIRIPLELWKLVELELLEQIPDMPEWAVVDGRLSPRILQALIDALGRNILYNTMSIYSFDKQLDTSGAGALLEVATSFLNDLGIPLHMYGMPHYDDLREATFKDILAPPVDPITGIFLEPYNPQTGRPFPDYLRWFGTVGYLSPLTGLFSSGPEGNNTMLGEALNMAHNTRHWPMELILEALGMFEFELTTSDEPLELLGFKVNTQALPLALEHLIGGLAADLFRGDVSSGMSLRAHQDAQKTLKRSLDKSYRSASQRLGYVEDYQKIDVPMLVFQSRLGLLLWGPIRPGIKNQDVTIGGVYNDMGHIDVYTGLNEERINRPTLEWLNRRSGGG